MKHYFINEVDKQKIPNIFSDYFNVDLDMFVFDGKHIKEENWFQFVDEIWTRSTENPYDILQDIENVIKEMYYLQFDVDGWVRAQSQKDMKRRYLERQYSTLFSKMLGIMDSFQLYNDDVYFNAYMVNLISKSEIRYEDSIIVGPYRYITGGNNKYSYLMPFEKTYSISSKYFSTLSKPQYRPLIVVKLINNEDYSESTSRLFKECVENIHYNYKRNNSRSLFKCFSYDADMRFDEKIDNRYMTYTEPQVEKIEDLVVSSVGAQIDDEIIWLKTVNTIMAKKIIGELYDPNGCMITIEDYMYFVDQFCSIKSLALQYFIIDVFCKAVKYKNIIMEIGKWYDVENLFAFWIGNIEMANKRLEILVNAFSYLTKDISSEQLKTYAKKGLASIYERNRINGSVTQGNIEYEEYKMKKRIVCDKNHDSWQYALLQKHIIYQSIPIVSDMTISKNRDWKRMACYYVGLEQVSMDEKMEIVVQTCKEVFVTQETQIGKKGEEYLLSSLQKKIPDFDEMQLHLLYDYYILNSIFR